MIIKSAEGLQPGDVLQVSKYIEPRGKDPYWWKSFRVVEGMPVAKRFATLIILRLDPDMEKDRDSVDFHAANYVIEKLEPERWPQGVIAMRMRYIHKGILKLE